MTDRVKTKHGVAYAQVEEAQLSTVIEVYETAQLLAELEHLAPALAPRIAPRRRSLIHAAMALVSAGNRASATFGRFAFWR